MTRQPLDSLDVEWLLLNWSAQMFLAARDEAASGALDDFAVGAVRDILSRMPSQDAAAEAHQVTREWVAYTIAGYQHQGRRPAVQHQAMVAREELSKYLRGVSRQA